MKSLIRTIGSAIIIVGLIFTFQKSKNYISDNVVNIYQGKKNKNEEEYWAVYLTKDRKLVLCNENNPHLKEFKVGSIEFSKSIENYFDYVNDSLCNILKYQLLHLYVDLLTYVITDSFNSEVIPKNIAFNIFRKDILIRKDIFDVLSKTYIDFKKDVHLKNDVRLATIDDIKIIKKSNIYSIILGDKIINIIFEIEVLLEELERQKISTKPYINYLNIIIPKNK